MKTPAVESVHAKHSATQELARRSQRPRGTLELEGSLLPCPLWLQGRRKMRYKLRTEDFEVPLELPRSLRAMAKSCLWEDVSVTGAYDTMGRFFWVQKIAPIPFEGGIEISEIGSDPFQDFEGLQRHIEKFGKLEPSEGIAAS